MESKLTQVFKSFFNKDNFLIALLLMIMLFLIFTLNLKADVTITLPSNGQNICAETASDGTSPSWTTLNNIVITELLTEDFPKNKTNETIVLSAPSGWSFNSGFGAITKNAGDISSIAISVTSTNITITWSTPNGGGDNDIDILTISGIQLRPDNTVSADGDITCSSISTPVIGITIGTVFANLSITDVPSITSDPSNASISSGQNTSFSITANNSPISYAWEYSDDSGLSWNLISDGGVYSNSSSATLNISGADLSMDSYLYRASAANACGTSSYSATAILNVTDICSSAISITGCGSSNSVTAITPTSGVWDPISSSCGYSTPGGELIYSYVPSVSGTVSLEITATDGSYIDYFIQEGTCSPTGWTCIGDYSSTGTFGSLALTSGNTYYFLLDDENTTSSQHTFYITCPIAPPTNEDCSNAIVIPCGTTDLAGTTNGTSVQTHGTGCSIGAYGVWYTFTGDGNETTISSSADFDHEMSICSGSCGSLTNIDCIDASTSTESYTFTPNNGVDYFIYISHYDSGSSTTGDFTLTRSDCLTDMNFVSCTSSQNNTDPISIGSVNQEILCIQVETDGSLNPLALTDIVVRTDGTTDYSIDISSLNIWFTGLSSSFSTSNHFGTAQNTASPGTDITFAGTQELETGVNYFWLTYDIPNGANSGDVVDAILQSITIDSSIETPTNGDPAGNRELIDGCNYIINLSDDYGDGWDTGLLTVQVDGVDVLTDISGSGYSSEFSFIAESGSTISTIYTPGSYPDENSYLIVNPNEAYILSSGEAGSSPTNESAMADCNAIKEFTVNGDTYHTDVSCFIITEDKTSQAGSLWNNYKINLEEDFSFDFEVNMGDDGGGADGIVFALQGDCTSAGSNGNQLGFGGISNSLGVEFDTYENGELSDLSDDHISIISGGSVDHTLSTNLNGPSSVVDIEDNVWYSVNISWDYISSSEQEFTVTFGATTLTYNGDIITDQFGGASQVFWGFTGSTGAYSNLQQVCINTYPDNSTELTDMYIEIGNSTNVEAATGANSYSWSPDDGTISDPSAYNPTLSPTEDTEYTCLIEDGCGNYITNKFTVFVDQLLPVEILYFDVKCQNDSICFDWETASEVNCAYYEIYTSDDMNNWKKLETVDSENTQTGNLYSSCIVNNGKNKAYYKLVDIDINGIKTDLAVKSVNCEAVYKKYIYPNPTKSGVNIVGVSNSEDCIIEIYDQTGRVIITQKNVEIDRIESGLYVDLSALTTGQYLVLIITDVEMFQFPVIKQ